MGSRNGNEFGSIDLLPRVSLRPYSLCFKFLLPRHSDYRYYDEKTIPFAITGDPISSKGPRLITSRTARNGAKFFDRSLPGSRSPNLLEPLPSDPSSRTLYPRNERFGSSAMLETRHRRSVNAADVCKTTYTRARQDPVRGIH